MAPNINSLEKQTWGTWEELLLACAVHRHGTDSWDSVATEVRKRSSGLHLLLTPQSCRQKYLDLERRFNRRDGGDDPDNAGDGGESNIPWLDELKRLRVAELRSELERYDLSIVSLQSKVKRLKEEREQSSTKIEKDAETSDLDGTGERAKDGEPAELLPDSFAHKPDSGEGCARDSQSVNESNSTDPKRENPETGREEHGKEPDPVESVEPAADGSEKIGQRRKPAAEDSCNGSTETIAKESPARNSERGIGDSGELGESVAESKSGRSGGGREEGTKESSDVQSSVSLSRKKDQEPDDEDQSHAINRPPSQSQPLADFLHVLRSHQFGSLFERRLDSQENPNYRNLIRQHLDLEKVGKRLEDGRYSGCRNKFFRDLLLVLNNAVVFYGNKSPESVAAGELRRLVAKEMATQAHKSDQPSNTKPAPAPAPAPHLKPASTSAEQGPVKPKISIPIAACRKRSSIGTKATSGTEKRRELALASLVDKKPVVAELKQEDKSFDNMEEAQSTKKRSRERSSMGGRSSNKNSKNSDNTNENMESKVEMEKKSGTSAMAGKKQSATNFLNRMKTSPDKSGKGGSEQQSRNANTKIDTRKDQASGKKGSSGKKQVKEQESPAKRRLGRPPKKVAPPPKSTGKRNREGGEMEGGASGNGKKRTRK